MTKSISGSQVPTDVTRDHVIPQRYKGRKQVLACHGCNNLKGDMMPEEWLRFVIEHMPERAEAVRGVFRAFRIQFVEPRLDDSMISSA